MAIEPSTCQSHLWLLLTVRSMSPRRPLDLPQPVHPAIFSFRFSEFRPLLACMPTMQHRVPPAARCVTTFIMYKEISMKRTLAYLSFLLVFTVMAIAQTSTPAVSCCGDKCSQASCTKKCCQKSNGEMCSGNDCAKMCSDKNCTKMCSDKSCAKTCSGKGGAKSCCHGDESKDTRK